MQFLPTLGLQSLAEVGFSDELRAWCPGRGGAEELRPARVGRVEEELVERERMIGPQVGAEGGPPGLSGVVWR
jgi:hypothetical protein